MGIRQYNRGSAAISRDIERTYFPNGMGIDLSFIVEQRDITIKDLRAKLAASERELDRARLYMRMARAERDVLRDELAADRASRQVERSSMKSTIDRLQLAWVKCSRIIRDCVSPEQVECVRQSNPDLWPVPEVTK